METETKLEVQKSKVYEANDTNNTNEPRDLSEDRITRAIKAPFVQKEALQRIGALIGITVLIFIPMIVIGLFGAFEQSYSYGPSSSSDDLLSILGIFYGLFLVLPYIVYIWGYVVSFTRSITKGDGKFPPIDMSHFKPGLKMVALYLIVVFFMSILFVVGGMLLVPISSGLSEIFPQELLQLFTAIFFIVVTIGALALSFFIVPSFYYNFIIEETITAGLSVSKAWNTMQKHYVKLLKMFGSLFLVGLLSMLAQTILSIIPILGILLIFPYSYYSQFVMLYVMSDFFREMYNEDNDIAPEEKVTLVEPKEGEQEASLKTGNSDAVTSN